MPTLQREYWDGSPVAIGPGFRLRLERGDKAHEAECVLLTHQLGFELRLNINGELRRSRVCRSTDEVLTTTEGWRAALRDKGWKDAQP